MKTLPQELVELKFDAETLRRIKAGLDVEFEVALDPNSAVF